MEDSKKTYNITHLEDSGEDRDYLRHKRDAQVKRAKKAIEADSSALEKKNANDYRRFVKKTTTNKKGKNVKINYSMNKDEVNKEKKFDGFYAVAVTLAVILQLNHSPPYFKTQKKP